MSRLWAATVLLCCAAGCGQEQARPVRVWAYDGLRPLVMRWETAFQSEHPGVHFENAFHGAAAVPAGLYDGVADVAVLGREWWPVDNMAFHWVYHYAPFAVDVVAAAASAPRASFTPVVIVNAANPLRKISTAELDAVFGSLHKQVPANVRTWRELGVAGPLADRTVEPVGFGEDDSLGVFFRRQVLKGDYKPNPASLLLEGPRADEDIAARVAQDPNALGYTSATAAGREGRVKVIPVAGADGQALDPSSEAIANGRYPLSRRLSILANRKPGDRLLPPVEKFLLFVLSEEGQREVHADEGYLALPAGARESERKRVLADWTVAEANKGWKE